MWFAVSDYSIAYWGMFKDICHKNQSSQSLVNVYIHSCLSDFVSCHSPVMQWLERVLWTELHVAWEERSFYPWSNSTSCRCCRTVRHPLKIEHKCQSCTETWMWIFTCNFKLVTELDCHCFFSSWLEVPPRWTDGIVCHWRGLPPTDGGHPPRDRQLCPPLLLWPCRQNIIKLDYFRQMYNTQ